LVKAICPKCNRKGEQHVYSDRKNSPRKYLEYIHKTDSGIRRCHIGRIRTTNEVMTEFEKKPTTEELDKMLNHLSNDIRNLISNYSPNTAVRMNVISKKLLSILKKYGY